MKYRLVTSMIKFIFQKCDAISGGVSMIKLRWYYPSPKCPLKLNLIRVQIPHNWSLKEAKNDT